MTRELCSARLDSLYLFAFRSAKVIRVFRVELSDVMLSQHSWVLKFLHFKLSSLGDVWSCQHVKLTIPAVSPINYSHLFLFQSYCYWQMIHFVLGVKYFFFSLSFLSYRMSNSMLHFFGLWIIKNEAAQTLTDFMSLSIQNGHSSCASLWYNLGFFLRSYIERLLSSFFTSKSTKTWKLNQLSLIIVISIFWHFPESRL